MQFFSTGYFKRQENIKQQEKQLTFKLSGIINITDNLIIDNIIIESSSSAIRHKK